MKKLLISQKIIILMGQNNVNVDEIQKIRTKINLSLKISEKVLGDFSNLIFMEV